MTAAAMTDLRSMFAVELGDVGWLEMSSKENEMLD